MPDSLTPSPPRHTPPQRTRLVSLPVTPAMVDAACAALPTVPRQVVFCALTAAMEAGQFYLEVWGSGGPGDGA